ncbi:MAG TPA: hypothetical protein VFE51_19480 [Verrucomicrobiae bacterium]|nr:hypothetical protein [Verrucomicrobiae bacterium]
MKCYLKLAATAKLDSLGVRVSSPQGRIPCSLNDNFYQNIIVLKFQSNADLTGATISLNYDRDLGHADYLVTNIVPDGGTIRANGVLVNLPDEYTNGRTY